MQGFPDDLAQSLGKDATLSDILQILDEHYGVVMMFDGLSKELYSLEQGLGENVAEYGVHLSQQVKILQLEYPGRIQPAHVEEMKHDCLYGGLNPNYQWMLAHKVDGENPAGYSDLLLVTHKLERKAEARSPLSPKKAVTNGSNAIHSQTPRNLFPSHKLEGNHTFTTQAVTIWNTEGEADSGAEQEGEGEMESLADKEVKVSGRVEGPDQPMEYIIHFAKAVKLYQQQIRSCFGCGSSNHLRWDCPKDLSKSALKVD